MWYVIHSWILGSGSWQTRTPAGMAPFGLLVHSKQICRGLSLQIGWGLSPITGVPKFHSGVLRTEIRVPWHCKPALAASASRGLPCPVEWMPMVTDWGRSSAFGSRFYSCVNRIQLPLAAMLTFEIQMKLDSTSTFETPPFHQKAQTMKHYSILSLAAENQALGWSDVQISYICGILRSIK